MSGSAEPAALITSPSFKLTADKLTNPLEAGVARPELDEGAGEDVGVAETAGLADGVGVEDEEAPLPPLPPPPPPPVPPPQAFELGVIITVLLVAEVNVSVDLSLKHSYV